MTDEQKPYAIVLDDDKFVNDLARDILEMCLPDYEIFQTCDVTQAKILAEQRVPKIIVSDNDLPELGQGLEFIRGLRGNPVYDQTQIILISGRYEVEKEINVPNVTFLKKPFSVKDLVSIVKSSQ